MVSCEVNQFLFESSQTQPKPFMTGCFTNQKYDGKMIRVTCAKAGNGSVETQYSFNGWRQQILDREADSSEGGVGVLLLPNICLQLAHMQ